ncbi:hypothetical protein BDC45DRAFT_514483 [Circinella umbellata]|nr:hypothetical protein BDC45DRAFT_514483 [Circinella umbellata]
MSRSMGLELDSTNNVDRGEAVVGAGAKDAKKLFPCSAGPVVGGSAVVVMIALFEVVVPALTALVVVVAVADVMVVEDADTCDPSTCSIAFLLYIYKSLRLKKNVEEKYWDGKKKEKNKKKQSTNVGGGVRSCFFLLHKKIECYPKGKKRKEVQKRLFVKSYYTVNNIIIHVDKKKISHVKSLISLIQMKFFHNESNENKIFSCGVWYITPPK